MKTVIDNNIFYGIELKQIDVQKVTIENPIVTNSNIDEFARSYNLVYKTETVRESLRIAMKLSNNTLIGINPYMYVLKLDNQLMKLTEHDKHIIELTEMVAKGYEVNAENEEEVMNEWIKPRESELQAIADVYNEWFDNIRTKANIDKNKLKVDEIVEYIKKLLDENIRNWTKLHLGVEIGISDDFDWSQLELYLNSFAAFFKSNLVGEGKFKPHDAYDLNQLIYVQPGDKFWTKEKKWQNIIYEKAKKGEYLLEYQGQVYNPLPT